jgi:DNA-binding PadR family transcriptional regulator
MPRARPLPLAMFHILVAVADRERHGYAIMQDVEARTDGTLRLGPGTLYGSIKRMLHDGLIEELDERPDPENDDVRRRYYRITPAGRRIAKEESARLAKLLRQARATGLAPKTA